MSAPTSAAADPASHASGKANSVHSKQASSSQSPAAKSQSTPPDQHPLDVIRRAKALGISRVCVGFSCGKDSVACLSLCREHFAEVRAYFMYMVPDLSFQESYISHIERRFAPLKIIRLPHWMLADMLRNSIMRNPTAKSKTLKRTTIRDIENHVRAETGIEWFATGEKYRDSLERQAQIKNCGGINAKRSRLYPLGWWSNATVYRYLRQQNIALPPDYNVTGIGKSFGSLWGNEIVPIKRHFPQDYEKIRIMFPEVEAQVIRYEAREAAAKRKLAASGV